MATVAVFGKVPLYLNMKGNMMRTNQNISSHQSQQVTATGHVQCRGLEPGPQARGICIHGEVRGVTRLSVTMYSCHGGS